MLYDFKHNENQVFEFLNTEAQDFYNGKVQFIDKSYASQFRGNLLCGILQIERTIRGTFGCDLSLLTVNIEMLKEMYPNICKNILKIENEEDKNRLSYYLTSLRNLNAHSFVSDEDLKFLNSDFSFLNNQKKMNTDVEYIINGKITVAGIIFLIINFHRARSIKTLVGCDFPIGVVSSGKFQLDDGERFVEEISRVNLEIDIRQEMRNDILGSIFGEYYDQVIFDKNKFLLVIGKKNYPTFKVSGYFDGTSLFVESGSLTRTYYNKSYLIRINEANEFIKYSNQLPMFAFVDYLYKSHIQTFDKSFLKQLEIDFKSFIKTNKPKFYTDKNLDLLLLKSNASDFRITSSLINNSIINLLLATENYIYKVMKIKRNNRYSTISDALESINVPEEIITEVKYLRNFCAHGYFLYDYLLYKENKRQFTLEYIILTIKRLSDYLEEHVKNVFNNFKEYKTRFLIDKVIKAKYKIAVAYSNIVISEFPNYNKEELSKKIGFINNSFYDIKIFNDITSFEIQKLIVIKLFIIDLNVCLYFYEGENSRDRIKYFCNHFGYVIKEEKDLGLIKEMKLEKSA